MLNVLSIGSRAASILGSIAPAIRVIAIVRSFGQSRRHHLSEEHAGLTSRALGFSVRARDRRNFLVDMPPTEAVFTTRRESCIDDRAAIEASVIGALHRCVSMAIVFSRGDPYASARALAMDVLSLT